MTSIYANERYANPDQTFQTYTAGYRFVEAVLLDLC